MKLRGAYLLCGLPHAGGGDLCALLRDRKVGDPDAYLEPAERDRLQALWGCANHGAYLAELWRRRSPGGWFGALVRWDDPRYGIDFPHLLPGTVRRRAFVLQTRDPLEQATAWQLAIEADGQPTQPGAEPVQWWAVDELAYTIPETMAAWRTYLASHGWPWLEVDHDALAADPEGVADLVEAWVRTEAPAV